MIYTLVLQPPLSTPDIARGPKSGITTNIVVSHQAQMLTCSGGLHARYKLKLTFSLLTRASKVNLFTSKVLFFPASRPCHNATSSGVSMPLPRLALKNMLKDLPVPQVSYMRHRNPRIRIIRAYILTTTLFLTNATIPTLWIEMFTSTMTANGAVKKTTLTETITDVSSRPVPGC